MIVTNDRGFLRAGKGIHQCLRSFSVQLFYLTFKVFFIDVRSPSDFRLIIEEFWPRFGREAPLPIVFRLVLDLVKFRRDVLSEIDLQTHCFLVGFLTIQSDRQQMNRRKDEIPVNPKQSVFKSSEFVSKSTLVRPFHRKFDPLFLISTNVFSHAFHEFIL